MVVRNSEIRKVNMNVLLLFVGEMSMDRDIIVEGSNTKLSENNFL